MPPASALAVSGGGESAGGLFPVRKQTAYINRPHIMDTPKQKGGFVNVFCGNHLADMGTYIINGAHSFTCHLTEATFLSEPQRTSVVDLLNLEG